MGETGGKKRREKMGGKPTYYASTLYLQDERERGG